MKRSIFISAMIAVAISLGAAVFLNASDYFFQSRLLPWDLPLIYLQDPGLIAANRLFPCQKEGFDTGCEAYKWAPTILGMNALAYFLFLLPGIHYYRIRVLKRNQSGG